MNILLDRSWWCSCTVDQNYQANWYSGGIDEQPAGRWLGFARQTVHGDSIQIGYANTDSYNAYPWLMVLASSTAPGEGELQDVEVLWSGDGYEFYDIPRIELPVGVYIYLQVNGGTPVADYNDSDYYLFRVDGAPDQIVAVDDESASDGGEVTTNVLANDTIGGAPATLPQLSGLPVITRQPEHGTVVVNSDGSITYTPNPGSTATEDSYEYGISAARNDDCEHLSGHWGGRFRFANGVPSWIDNSEGSLVFIRLFGSRAYQFAFDSDGEEMYLDEDTSLPYGSGYGELSQGDESICITWSVPDPA